MKTVKGAAMAKERRFSTIDINLSSFLELNGLHASLELIKGKVVFVFPANDTLYKLLEAYNSNSPVPVGDFVTRLKILRGQMLTMRGQR
ncbi:MAG: hypothetical protein COS27_10430 [Nitrospirae bacterium CG02_land_8_20_14_3_00_41_53]|nr:MAG: hypothetical protein COS27_10430 [Nitrospirae bacterium CG02_land_8_20_14_3_00_41_53]PIW88228.1 MAG: hypothetical protein COZ94_01015 [Nitrospirae bacterium CG_4_8_14_3_um_filter_41_47]